MKKLIIILTGLLIIFNTGAAGVYYFLYLKDDVPGAEQADDDKLASVNGSEASDGEGSGSTEGLEPILIDGVEFHEDYYSIHFSYGDAVDLCIQEARSRNNNIIQLVVNEHSTRFNEKEGFYLVKLDSYVGTPRLYDEKAHTCEVDPKIQGVAFYKEIIRRKAVRPIE